MSESEYDYSIKEIETNNKLSSQQQDIIVNQNERDIIDNNNNILQDKKSVVNILNVNLTKLKKK